MGLARYGVPFFEPRPPVDEPARAPWRPPLWDRPSEGTLGALLPVGEIVARGDAVVASIDHLRVYPNGFGIDLLILRNPDVAQREDPHLRMRPGNWPRIGVRFADGRTAGREAGFGARSFDMRKDPAGVPTSLVMHPMGGGGGGAEYHMRVWVFPLPPDGPMDIYVQIGALPEGHVTIDGARVREAAGRAHVIWS
jgi:hypothetical protein